MNVVLVEPEIPPNTGNIARICAATNSTLHLIEPMGFKLDDSALKRAGMDYWKHVHWKNWQNWATFIQSVEKGTLWFVETGAPRSYTEAKFEKLDYLIFGRESAGLPLDLIRKHQETWIDIPIFNEAARSLNLSNCVAIVLYEAVRQQQVTT